MYQLNVKIVCSYRTLETIPFYHAETYGFLFERDEERYLEGEGCELGTKVTRNWTTVYHMRFHQCLLLEISCYFELWWPLITFVSNRKQLGLSPLNLWHSQNIYDASSKIPFLRYWCLQRFTYFDVCWPQMTFSAVMKTIGFSSPQHGVSAYQTWFYGRRKGQHYFVA